MVWDEAFRDRRRYSTRPSLALSTVHLFQPYIVVPRLGNLVSPPMSSDMGNVFRLPPRPPVSTYYPPAGYTYLQRIPSFAGLDYLQVGGCRCRELFCFVSLKHVWIRRSIALGLWFVVVQMPVYARHHESFANNFLEEFIGRSIEDELIPDILLEIIDELEQVNHLTDEWYVDVFLCLAWRSRWFIVAIQHWSLPCWAQ